ncbi:pyruvate carboxylase subunit B [Mammaliicoccus sciuri]|uniref:Oxaloacetate decarboxylase, alpha subunit n=1 Tax=Sporosarcina newyorkensis TaxID=759851 RepID=A0A1T4XZ05_9BACL|nr:pyruvate carboxylase subunit B [Sporosarcina newyorkensis]SKA94782.1 oxaloacetate decarboxylase, alpha subunit [Sporosarcina newyorkensis]
MRKIKIIDQTLRDAHQSLWATRMTTAQMYPILDQINRAGYDAVDLMAMAHFDSCVRYLREDPWERIRLVRDKLDVPIGGWMRSNNLIGFEAAPDDLVELFVDKMVDNGINRITAYDGLLDNSNIIDTLKQTKKLGAQAVAAFVYCDSPIHTDELYVERISKLLKEVKVDAVMLKDAGGLLTPDRVRTLIPAIKKTIGDLSLEVHSHCSTGLAPLVYLESVKHGADAIHTGVAPLANGCAMPAVQTLTKNLRDMNYQLNIDNQMISEIEDHIRMVAKTEGFPEGTAMEYDAFHYKHQIPGGMLTNMYFQLEQAGIRDRYEEVLNEISTIREELAWPIMVTPFSQLVGTQAVLNVIHGERYKFVPDELKKYALGYYGELIAPIEQNILDKIIENGSKDIPLQRQPLVDVVPQLRKQYPNATDEERLLRFMIKGNHVNEMKKAGPINTGYNMTNDSISTIIKSIIDQKKFGYIQINSSALKLKLGAMK